MPVDLSMYPQAPKPVNPLEMASQIMGMQHTALQNQLVQRTMGAQQATGEATQGATGADGSFDPAAAMAAARGNPNAAYGMTEYAANMQAQRQAQLSQQHEQMTVAWEQQQHVNQQIAGLLAKPNVSVDDVTHSLGDLVAAKIIPASLAASQAAEAQQNAGNGDGIGGHAQSLSSSLMEVLERVRSSTRLTMTAQYKFGPGSPFGNGLPGIVPDTTTEYGGTSPM